MDTLMAYWSRFEKSGDPKDYLEYCRSRRNHSKEIEREDERCTNQS